MSENKRPGLPSLNASRATRYRQLTSGKTAIGGIPPKLFLGGLAILVIGGFVYFQNAQSAIDAQRSSLMAKQRAVAEALGPKLLPIQAAVDKGLAALTTGPFKDERASDVDFSKLFTTPGLYLRLRKEDAKDAKRGRAAAQKSLRDGFTSCLIRDPKASAPQEGSACKESRDCEPGALCSEYKVCQRPSSPFNMRLLYRAVSVLSPEWVAEVEDASSELGLIAYERGLDSVTRVDIPVAIEVYQRAKYFVIVVDEDPPEGLPKALDGTDETAEERIQRVAHPARVGVWELPSGRQLARLSAQAAGELREVGVRKGMNDAISAAGRTRQATSCGLALEVLAKLNPAPVVQDVQPR